MAQLVFIHGPGAGACADAYTHQLAHFKGSVAPTLPGQLSDAYGCGKRGIVVEGPGTPLLDTGSPLWTVRLFDPLKAASPDGASEDIGELLERESVAVAYYAGRPDPVR